MTKTMTNDFESEDVYPWYEVVEAGTRLSQGDIIFNCPITRWAASSFELKKTEQEHELLASLIEVAKADVIVMNQACDLENEKVKNVILCPHLSLEKYEENWLKFMQQNNPNQEPKTFKKQWTRTCEDIRRGYNWNLTMINSGEADGLSLSHRIIDFHDIYTLPRVFLESLLQNRAEPRFRLRPPYREHLSQAFARFFMRVGIPTSIKKVW
jgi:hypothetical protein